MTSLNRRSNIFDDNAITPEKVKKYRDASALVLPKDNDFSQFDLGLKKRRMSVPNIRNFSTPLKNQMTKSFLSNSVRPEMTNKNLEIEKENLSSSILRNINTNIEFQRTQESPRDQTDYRQRNDLDRANLEDQKVREYDNSLLPVDYKTMEEEPIQLNDPSKNLNFIVGPSESPIKKEASTQNDLIEQLDSTTQTNIENPERISIETQDREVNTEFPLEEIKEQNLCDQGTQIENSVLEIEEVKKEELIKQRIEAVYREHLEAQSRQIMELQDLLHMKEDELSQVRNQIKTLKLSFLGQLSNLKEQMAQVTSEQYNNKQNIEYSLKETIQFLIQLISSNLSNYINERNHKEKDNLLMYKLQVSGLREELQKLKEFVLLVIGRLKEGIAQQFEGEVKNELQKMIDESSKGKILKLHDLFNENVSITTDSSAATPRKENAPKKTPRKRHAKIDPAIIEGMKYLLDHEALKNPFNTKQNFKEKLDKMLKSPDHAELDSSLVLSTLMERSTRRSTKSPAPSQASQMNSSTPKKTPSKRNVKAFEAAVERADDEISEMSNSSKRIKKELQHYTSFTDHDGEKFLVVDENNKK